MYSAACGVEVTLPSLGSDSSRSTRGVEKLSAIVEMNPPIFRFFNDPFPISFPACADFWDITSIVLHKQFMSYFSCSRKILSWRWAFKYNLAYKGKTSSSSSTLCCKQFFCTSLEERQPLKIDVKMATLETLNFDNLALRALPIDKEVKNYVRQVSGACFSRVEPTPVENATTVAYSSQAMSLLDLPEDELKRVDFAEFFSGNKLLPGAQPSAHCYCGHQFGYFSGQLGDGAAM